METEQQAYEVPGRQLGWRVSQLQAHGYPYHVQQMGGGVYVIVVQHPVGATPFAYKRQSYPAFERPWLLRLATILALAAIACGLMALLFLRASDAPDAAAAAEPGASGDWFAALHLPWDNAAPEQAQQQAQQEDGWRWPWDAAMENAADAAASVQGTVTTISLALLGVLVLLIVLVRRRR